MARDDYKTRNWVTIVYPESAPEGWRDRLRDECIQALVSPLHSADMNADETQKKAHWHVMLMFDGPKRQSMAQNIVTLIGGVGCKPCNSVRGYARYLCHLDNPEKAQYETKDVECFGGVDYFELISLPTDLHRIIKEIEQWCRDTNCLSFARLCDYAAEYKEDWFRALNTKCSHLVYRYIMSLGWEFEKGMTRLPAKKQCKYKAEEIEEKRQEQLEEMDFWLSLDEEEAEPEATEADAMDTAEDTAEVRAEEEEEVPSACADGEAGDTYQQESGERMPRWRRLKEKMKRKDKGRKRR